MDLILKSKECSFYGKKSIISHLKQRTRNKKLCVLLSVSLSGSWLHEPLPNKLKSGPHFAGICYLASLNYLIVERYFVT